MIACARQEKGSHAALLDLQNSTLTHLLRKSGEYIIKEKSATMCAGALYNTTDRRCHTRVRDERFTTHKTKPTHHQDAVAVHRVTK